MYKKIEEINEDITKSVAKKVITMTSSGYMPFGNLTLSVTKKGYGFTLRRKNKNIFLSVRASDELVVIVNNQSINHYAKYPISDVTLEKLPTDSSIESYKKYCVNTIVTIIKTWFATPDDKKPDLGEWNLYKF